MKFSVLILAGLALISVSGFAEEELPGEPSYSTFENAAFDYWRASALLRPIASRADFEIVLFAERDVADLPPSVFAHRPEVGQWLLGDRKMARALRDAGSKTYCAFNPQGPLSASPDLRYLLLLMRSVMTRAITYAHAMEFVRKAGEASAVYADLFRMLDHLNSDQSWASSHYAIGQLPILIRAVEGFLSRRPPREDLEPLIAYFEQLQYPHYSQCTYLHNEMRQYARWLIKEAGHAEKKLAQLYGDRPDKPAVEQLVQLDEAERRALLDTWLRGYEDEIKDLCAATNLPYPQGLQAVAEIDNRILQIRDSPDKPDLNHALPLFMPPMKTTYEKYLAAEAMLRMVYHLLVAAEYRDFVGAWPESAELVLQFGQETLPPDPFTGGPFKYAHDKKGPRISTDAPKWLLKEDRFILAIDLGKRVQQDEDRLKEYLRDKKKLEKQKEAEQRSVHQKSSNQQEPGTGRGGNISRARNRR